jgi:hypothetical protein
MDELWSCPMTTAMLSPFWEAYSADKMLSLHSEQYPIYTIISP